MKKIFIINGGQKFAHSGGQFNQTVQDWTVEFLSKNSTYEIKTTHIENEIDLQEEVEKFVWADLVIYHTPIWWFQIPNLFKKYIDDVFTQGHNNGIYKSDGRSRVNPDINYGTGGLLHGRNVHAYHQLERTCNGFYTSGRILRRNFCRRWRNVWLPQNE
jgi:modulator of drug activity B